jgi:hypothetical protein
MSENYVIINTIINDTWPSDYIKTTQFQILILYKLIYDFSSQPI